MGSQNDRKNPGKKMVQIELKFNVLLMRNLSSKSEKQSHVSQQPVRHLTHVFPACMLALVGPWLPALSGDTSPWSTSDARIQHVRLNTRTNLKVEDVEQTFFRKMHRNPGLRLQPFGPRIL